MICDFNRYYVTADYIAPYNDIKSIDFIGLSTCIMYDDPNQMLEKANEYRKNKKLFNIRLSMIPAGTRLYFDLEYKN